MNAGFIVLFDVFIIHNLSLNTPDRTRACVNGVGVLRFIHWTACSCFRFAFCTIATFFFGITSMTAQAHLKIVTNLLQIYYVFVSYHRKERLSSNGS